MQDLRASITIILRAKHDKSYELAGIVKEVADEPELPVQVDQDGVGLEYSGDNSRLKSEFKELRLTPIRDAIQELYGWYRDNKGCIDRNLLLVDK
ncbi:hypothetical protein FACS1894199_16620 [Bacteroidia bacterium]|nr:hypothetical protein FACS1894199_16620 [Bacteroidia bacterium]